MPTLLSIDDPELIAMLAHDEDFSSKPYRDTEGKLTIGFGRNLDDRGISPEEAQLLAHNDRAWVFADLDRALPWWKGMPLAWQRALADMTFNLGLPRLLGFKKALAAMKAGDGKTAAAELRDSRWHAQVGDRAERIASAFEKG